MATQKKIIKTFCDADDQSELGKEYDQIERYEGFILLEVTAKEAARIAARFPVEDITDQYTIHVGARKINTRTPRLISGGKWADHPAYKGVEKLSRGKHHHLVQFIGPVKKNWLTGLIRMGAELRRPYGNFSYIVRASVVTLNKIAKLRYVRWIGHLSHRDRLQITDKAANLPRTKNLPGAFMIEFFDAKDLSAAKRHLKALNCNVVSSDQDAAVTIIDLSRLSLDRRRRMLDKLSTIHGVAAIRQKSLKRTSNNVATKILESGNTVSVTLGLSGRGETIAVCDTGIDVGHAATIHTDFRGRIAGIKSYPITADLSQWINNPGGNDGAADVDSGHGTHVAGSVLGSGRSSIDLPGLQRPIRGFAHRAKLYFQAVEQAIDWKNPADLAEYGRFLLAGIPDDLTVLFNDAYRAGARIHSNSWGGGTPGEYDSQSRQLDSYVWQHPDFCVLVAAGNDGTDYDGDGKINRMSVTSPATAKNCITVGASESRRRQFNGERYGDWWPQDYPVPPYKRAPMANSPNQVVAFSSRGPTQDGRTKPEVVAPGTYILSARSRAIAANNSGWSAFSPSRMYFYMGGTSMATPLVAGAIGALREFLRTWVGYRNPSAALLKACLVAGARKLTGYSSAYVTNDNEQGFGLVDLDAIVDPPRGSHVYFLDDTIGLTTGQVDDFDVQVLSSSRPLRIAMAYSDYPGERLINNLNLVLVSPTGRTYVGNGRSGGMLVADSKNNVETVRISSPARGRWRVRIIGSNVVVGPQRYAMMLSGRIRA